MMFITVAQFHSLFPNCKQPDVWQAAYSEIGAAYDVNTQMRWRHLLAQGAEETGGFVTFIEYMNYRPEILMELWPERYPTLESTNGIAHNPIGFAKAHYDGRYGNVNPGDGLRYIGRSPGMITFHDNYVALQKRSGLNCVENPDLLLVPRNGAIAAMDYFKSHGCFELADKNDLRGITLKLQGGLGRLSARAMWLEKVRPYFPL